jgi:hypothetical protein
MNRFLPAPRRLLFGGALLMAVMAEAGCDPAGDAPMANLEPGTGGAQCFQAFDFNKPVTASVVLDGQKCPNANASCGAGDNDWPVSTALDSYAGSINVNTGLAHYRITPPVPPTQSDLYLYFEATDADINDIVAVTVALSPTATATDGKAVVIRPFAVNPPPGAVDNQAPAAAPETRRWTGAWTAWAAPGTAVQVRAAYNTTTAYWGVEVKLHLADFGITGDQFFLATRWRGEPENSANAIELWKPLTSDPNNAADFPTSDPTTWLRMSFGANCMPDVSINSQWNTCADIYINARDANARKIGIDNVNEFHAVVHGDPDAGDPSQGGVTANGVLVYLDISHLGNGAQPFAMNYPHTDANINWESAANSLATATPEPPTPFNVAAGASNDDVRLQWKPASEAPNPFANGEHVCVNAYVYFKDDPNLDNNFGQCNMEFVQAVPGRALMRAFGMGMGFRQVGRTQQDVTELVLLPAVLNSGYRVDEKHPLPMRLTGDGVEGIGDGGYRVRLPGRGRDAELRMELMVPDEIFTPLDKERVGRNPQARLTREFYGERPLVVLQSFIPRIATVGARRITVLTPASYVGFALERGEEGGTARATYDSTARPAGDTTPRATRDTTKRATDSTAGRTATGATRRVP